MREFHRDFAWLVVSSNGLVGLWALGAHWVAGMRHRALWWCTVAAQLTIFVQAVSGAWLVGVHDIEADDFHLFYGFGCIIVVGILYSYRPQLRDWVHLLYGFGGLFLMGLALWAMYL